MANPAGIQQLLRAFGQGLDREVLESVLELHQGDVALATAFLQAQGGDFVEQAPQAGQANQERLPEHYLDRPRGFSLQRLEQLGGVAAQHPAVRLKNFFLSEVQGQTFSQHLHEHARDAALYEAVALALISQGVTLSTNARSRVLAVLWTARKHVLAQFFLRHFPLLFGFTEVLRAVRLLDAPRKIRQIQRRITQLQRHGKVKQRTLGVLRARMHDVSMRAAEGQQAQQGGAVAAAAVAAAAAAPARGNRHRHQAAQQAAAAAAQQAAEAAAAEAAAVNDPAMQVSLSGALQRRINKWLGTLEAGQLTFYALQFPTELWRELVDVTHARPTDLAVPWFLPYCHGVEPAADSIVAQCRQLAPHNVSELAQRFDIPYSFLRVKLPDALPQDVLRRVVEYESIDSILWFYEEISGGNVGIDRVIERRIADGEEPKFTYGKLMERLLSFKMSGGAFYEQLIPVAEKRLHQIQLKLEPPVVVLGDASYSMDVAIRSATIIASLLSALCNADLRFFNVQSFPPARMPRTAADVVDIALNTRADGLTAPAVALWEYYQKKEKVKCFIMVTDEVENEPYQGYFFAQLFYHYYTEVEQAKLVFVSFLDDPRQKGRMVRALESFGIVPLQFRLDGRRPDLTKLDSLFGLLAADNPAFAPFVLETAEKIKRQGMEAVLEEFRPAEPRGADRVIRKSGGQKKSGDGESGGDGDELRLSMEDARRLVIHGEPQEEPLDDEDFGAGG